MVETTASTPVAGASTTKWPLEIRALLESLSRPTLVEQERRTRQRTPFRLTATIHAGRDQEPVEVYLRDYDDRAVAFVGSIFLAKDQHVELEIPDPNGTTRRVKCRVGRCRQFIDGWFEGMLMAGK